MEVLTEKQRQEYKDIITKKIDFPAKDKAKDKKPSDKPSDK